MKYINIILSIIFIVCCQSCGSDPVWYDEPVEINLSEHNIQTEQTLKDLYPVYLPSINKVGCIISPTPLSYAQWFVLNTDASANGYPTLMPSDQEIEQAKEDIKSVPVTYEWLTFSVSNSTASFKVNTEKADESFVNTLYVATVLGGQTGWDNHEQYVYIWKVNYNK